MAFTIYLGTYAKPIIKCRDIKNGLLVYGREIFRILVNIHTS